MGQGSVKIYRRTLCTLGPEALGPLDLGLIRVQGARVNNLKDGSVDISKRRTYRRGRSLSYAVRRKNSRRPTTLSSMMNTNPTMPMMRSSHSTPVHCR